MITQEEIRESVSRALLEDVGSGDVSAQIIPENVHSRAIVISRDIAIICGTQWFDEVFKQLDPEVTVNWHIKDGDKVSTNQTLCEINGPSRALLTGERTALNFLQTISGVSTLANRYMVAISGTGTKILDTRKTLPGLRKELKYAVKCGGCYNHRMGLYDEILIKENHIQAAGSIAKAIEQARSLTPTIKLGVEVKTIDELKEALTANPDGILLDNMELTLLRRAVTLTANKIPLEASGGVTINNIRSIADTGVDYISVGSLTKNLTAIDLSMQFL
jgi:nicotinate-nucleotide pyrophosphorylase (carboxylating)